MNPLPPEQGVVYLIPLNMVQAGTAKPEPVDEPAMRDEEAE